MEAVDIARLTVQENLATCGQWRKATLNTVIFLAQSYRSQDETTALAIVLVDKFLASRIHRRNDQTMPSTAAHTRSSENLGIPELHASACFVIATKMKNSESPCFADVLRLVRPSSNIAELGACEEDVLETVGWDVHATTGEAYSGERLCDTHHFDFLQPSILQIT